MSTATKLLPTRLELLRGSRRLERVTRGAALLRRKREALVTELFTLARPAADARARIDQGARRGYQLLLRALAFHGRSGVRTLASPVREVEVDVTARQVWGIPVASIASRPPLTRTVPARGYAPGPAGPSTTAAAEAFEQLSELLLDAATREMLIRRLGDALARTSRQVQTLERRVQPALRRQLGVVRQTLEEREREEHLRLKHLRKPFLPSNSP